MKNIVHTATVVNYATIASSSTNGVRKVNVSLQCANALLTNKPMQFWAACRTNGFGLCSFGKQIPTIGTTSFHACIAKSPGRSEGRSLRMCRSVQTRSTCRSLIHLAAVSDVLDITLIPLQPSLFLVQESSSHKAVNRLAI